MFTIYNDEENKFQIVEEPDPLLSYTYADYLESKFEQRVELIKGRIFKMGPAPNPEHQQISNGEKIYADEHHIESSTVKGLTMDIKHLH